MKSMLPVYALISLLVTGNIKAGTIEYVAKDMATELNLSSTSKVAILDFECLNNVEEYSSQIIRERLTTAFSRLKVFSVIERSLLNKVFAELKLHNSGAVESGQAKQIGKLAGADYVVTGSLSYVKGVTLELNVRAIKTESAEIVSARTVAIDRTWDTTANVPAISTAAISKEVQGYLNEIASYSEVYDWGHVMDSCTRLLIKYPENSLGYINRAKAAKNIVIERYQSEYKSGNDVSCEDHQGLLAGAIKDLGRASELQGRNAEVYKLRSEVFESMCKLREALGDINQAISINPKESSYLMNKAILKFRLNDYDWDKFAEAALNVSTQDSFNYLFVAQLYTEKGSPGKAVSVLNRAIKAGDGEGFIKYRNIICSEHPVSECAAP